MSLRELFTGAPHPFAVDDRVEFGGKKGIVLADRLPTGDTAAYTAFVTIAFDNQGDRRPGEPEHCYRLPTSAVRLVSAVERLGELVP